MMFRPGSFTATGSTVKQLIAEAYKVKDFQVSGGAGWISSGKYDIEAKVPDALVEELQKLPPDQRLDKFGWPQTSGGKAGRHLPQRNERP